MAQSFPRLSHSQIRDWFSKLPREDFSNRRILLIVPNATEPTPLAQVFDALFHEFRPLCFALDVLVALGTDPPLSDVQISNLLGIDQAERRRLFFQTQFFNHDWDRNDRLLTLGTVTSDECAGLTQGLVRQEISVEVNSRIQDYDLLLLLGPVAPEKLIGFSGGNSLLIPGIAGPEPINLLDRLANSMAVDQTFGVKDAPARLVIDGFSQMIPQVRRAITFVSPSEDSLQGLFYGTPESAFNDAVDLSVRM